MICQYAKESTVNNFINLIMFQYNCIAINDLLIKSMGKNSHNEYSDSSFFTINQSKIFIYTSKSFQLTVDHPDATINFVARHNFDTSKHIEILQLGAKAVLVDKLKVHANRPCLPYTIEIKKYNCLLYKIDVFLCVMPRNYESDPTIGMARQVLATYTFNQNIFTSTFLCDKIIMSSHAKRDGKFCMANLLHMQNEQLCLRTSGMVCLKIEHIDRQPIRIDCLGVQSFIKYPIICLPQVSQPTPCTIVVYNDNFATISTIKLVLQS